MASKIDICNMALSFIGCNTIADINEKSVEAEQCNLFYDTALEQVLREHPWNFAQARERLIGVDLPEAMQREYSFGYAYPQRCMAVQFLLDEAGRKSRRFEVFTGMTRPIIATDIEAAVAAFTKRIDDATFYDQQFVQVLARRLQCLIVKPLLKNNPSLVKEAEELYRHELAQAMTSDAREGRAFQDHENQWDGGHNLSGNDWVSKATEGFYR